MHISKPGVRGQLLGMGSVQPCRFSGWIKSLAWQQETLPAEPFLRPEQSFGCLFYRLNPGSAFWKGRWGIFFGICLARVGSQTPILSKTASELELCRGVPEQSAGGETSRKKEERSTMWAQAPFPISEVNIIARIKLQRRCLKRRNPRANPRILPGFAKGHFIVVGSFQSVGGKAMEGWSMVKGLGNRSHPTAL